MAVFFVGQGVGQLCPVGQELGKELGRLKSLHNKALDRVGQVGQVFGQVKSNY